MAGVAVMNAVKDRLVANWSEVPFVEDDTSGEKPADGSTYLTVEYPVAREDQITIGAPGNNVFRESGAFRLVLVAQLGTGTVQLVTWLDQLRALFRGKQFAGVTTYAPSPAATSPASYRPGRFEVSSSVPYFFDLFA